MRTDKTSPLIAIAPSRPKLLLAGMMLYSIAIFGSQAMMSVGAGISLLLMIAAQGPGAFWNNLRVFCREKFPRRYLLITHYFMAACVLSIFVARLWPLEIGGVLPNFDLKSDFGKIWYFYWPLVLGAGWMTLDKTSRARLRYTFLIAAGVISIIGILQFFTGFPVEQPVTLERKFFHTTGFFGFHLTYASVMIFPFFLTFEKALARDPAPLGRNLAWFLSVCGAIALILTLSRTLWVALPLGMTLLILVRVNRKLMLPLLAGLLALGLGVAQIPIIKTRLFSNQGKQDRYEVWDANVGLFKLRPITGVGWHKNAGLVEGYYRIAYPNDYQDRFVSHAHNNFLQFLAGTGILGALGFLLWVGITLWAAANASTALLVALLMFQVNGLTQSNLLESKSCHMMMYSIALALFLAARPKENST